MQTIEEQHYKDNPLDASGSFLKRPIADYLWKYRVAGTVFEWCSGIGEIGFELLKEGACDKLVLADICPESIEVARQIAKRDEFLDDTEFYVSDNFKDIPPQKFDLVVGNPPTYCNIQRNHPAGGQFAGDRRAHDPDWSVHREFYRNVGKYLAPGGKVIVHEIEPFKKRVFIDSEIPYDIRPMPPILAFDQMIQGGELQLVGVNAIESMHPEVRSFLVESVKL